MTQSTVLVITLITNLALVMTGIGALYFYARQARAARKEHVANVYRLAFERIDTPEIRAARHYVYAMDLRKHPGTDEWGDPEPEGIAGLTFQREQWTELDVLRSDDLNLKKARDHRGEAEKIARALDQLGFLVREGIVPLNIVACFYAYPTLRCWYLLMPYIDALRKKRKQKGHMWEWEKLAGKIMDYATREKGIWKGSLDHDDLKILIKNVATRSRALNLLTDTQWAPPDKSWTYTG